MKAIAALVAFTVGLSLSSFAHAATLIYDTPDSTIANNQYGHLLGLDFRVNNAVNVTALGAFDDPYDTGQVRFGDGIIGHIYVGIFNLDLHSYAVPLTDFVKSLNETGQAYIVKDLASPVLLNPGNYSVVSYLFSDRDLNYSGGVSSPTLINFNSLGGSLTDVGSRFGLPFGVNPDVASALDPVPNNPLHTAYLTVTSIKSAYGAGTFAADVVGGALTNTVSGVPEPATWSLLLLGFGMIGFALRRRSQTADSAAT